MSSQSEHVSHHHSLFSQLAPVVHLPSLALEEIKVYTHTCTLTALRDTGISDVSLPSPKRQFLAQCGASLRSSFILHREISYSTKSAILNVRSYRKLKSLFEYLTPRIKNLVLSIICFICHSSYQPLGRMWYNFLIELLQNQREENASHPKLSMV